MQRTRDWRRAQFLKRRKRHLTTYFWRGNLPRVVEGDTVTTGPLYGRIWTTPLWKAAKQGSARAWWWERDYDGNPYSRHGRENKIPDYEVGDF